VRLKRLLMTGPGKGLVAVAAVGALALANAAPAAAAEALPGAGAFSGYENAPTDFTLYGFPPILNGPPNVLCALYKPSASSPLVETLYLTGTFNGLTITPPGTAVFVDSGTNYDASPLGTFTAGTACISLPFSVPGTLTVTVTGDSCSGPATYTRVGSNVVIESTALSCTGSGTSAIMVLTGVEVPTSLVPVLTGPDANLAGTYVQA
jgi:hypothetical protein